MSRIGQLPISLPAGVTVEQQDHQMVVKGPKGTLTRQLPPDMRVEVEEASLRVLRPSDSRQHRALHGLTRALLANMVQGVTQGFQKVLELYGVGYRAQVQGKKLVMQLGFSHPVEVEAPPGIDFAVETFPPTQENNYLTCRVTISGMDRELVGQVAATIRAKRKPEPYKGKGLRYLGEVVRRKAGKTAAQR